MDQRTGPPPDREAILATLRAHRPELEAMGVVGLSLFGSVARGEAGPGSDIDLAVRYDSARSPAWAGGGIVAFLEDTFGHPVHLLFYPPHREELRRRIDRERVDVF